MAKFWYAYNGINDPFKVSSYAKLIPPRLPLCAIGASLCAVYTTGTNLIDTPTEPFSRNIQQYIALALTDGHTPQPRNSGKYYVYMKD